MDKRPIGIFDSGIGGLSILSEVKKILPNESFIYLADQANMPYGGKTRAELIGIVGKCVQMLLERDVKLIIIACNTATVYTIEDIRAKFGLPIIGVVPVIKTIAEATKTGKTAVISTPATAKSEYLSNLIEKFSQGKKVYIVGETGLEELVEKGDLNNQEVRKTLEETLLPLVEEGVDSIALGCTHYSFIKNQIQDVIGDSVGVFDSGPAIGRRTKEILLKKGILSDKKNRDFFITTGSPDNFKKIASDLLKTTLARVEHASYNVY